MRNKIIQGDIREIAKTLEPQSVNCIVTSPPYWGLRDYGHDSQIGHEPTPEAYVTVMVDLFRDLRRTLRNDGTVWLNLGDSYSSGLGEKGQAAGGKMNGNSNRPITSLPTKNLIGIPWRVALALQADGWYLRSDIIWSKPNPMPESVTDRPTKAHEYIFLLSKSASYYYDGEAIKEQLVYPNESRRPLGSKGAWQLDGRKQRANGGGSHYDGYPDSRNKRTVWTVATKPYSGAHFAVFPPDLIKPCILAGCPPGGIVFDPFFGSGTVAQVAIENGRDWLGAELNHDYIDLARKRIAQAQPALFPMDSPPMLNERV